MKGRWITAVAGMLALALPASTAVAATPSVSLVVQPTSAAVDEQISLIATAHGFPVGARLVIELIRAGRTTALATCSKASCTGSYRGHRAGSGSFEAVLLKGERMVAHSAPVKVTWSETAPTPAPTPTPAPAPAPTPPAGHYCGLTNEGKSICFDVTSPQSAVQNLRTEMIANCGDGSSWIWTVWFDAPVSILQPGLTMSYPYSGSLPDNTDSKNIQISYEVDATFDTAGNASGTIHLNHISWDQAGTHYDCAGDPRTWTARLGA